MAATDIMSGVAAAGNSGSLGGDKKGMLSGLLSEGNPAMAIISGILSVASPLITYGLQKGNMDRAEAEENKRYKDDQERQRQADVFNRTISKQEMGLRREGAEESKRQFNLNYQANRSDTAYNRLKSQFQDFAKLLETNEDLRDRYINRIGKLRG